MQQKGSIAILMEFQLPIFLTIPFSMSGANMGTQIYLEGMLIALLRR